MIMTLGFTSDIALKFIRGENSYRGWPKQLDLNGWSCALSSTSKHISLTRLNNDKKLNSKLRTWPWPQFPPYGPRTPYQINSS